jgi:hypothetical protein
MQKLFRYFSYLVDTACDCFLGLNGIIIPVEKFTLSILKAELDGTAIVKTALEF